MSSNALGLAPDEVVHWSGHPRLMNILPDAVLGILLIAVGITSVVAPELGDQFLPREIVLWLGVLIPIGTAIPVWTYLVITNTQFVITNRSLYIKRGILGRRVEQVDLSRVQNSSVSQGLRGTLLGYGTVSIDTAGVNSTIQFYTIENPQEVRSIINQQASEDDSPGSLEQWTAVLAEVRALREALETAR